MATERATRHSQEGKRSRGSDGGDTGSRQPTPRARRRARHPSAAHFQLTVEQAPSGVAHVGLDGRFLYVNPAWCRITGYTREESRALTYQTITHPDDLEASEAAVERLLAGAAASYDLDKRILRKDGAPVWIHLTVSLARTPDGEPDFLIALIEDISRRKGLEDEVRAVQALTDAALAHLGLEDLLHELLGRLRDVMAADNAAILLADEAGRELILYSALGPEEAVQGHVRIPVGQGVAGRIAALRTPLIVDNLAAAEVANPVLSDQLRSLVGVPLVIGERLVGVMHVDSAAERRFGEQDVRLLHVVADRIALAIDHARLHTRAQIQARELATIVGSITDGVWVIDTTGQIVWHNAAFRTVWGVNAQPDFVTDSLTDRADRVIVRDEHGDPLPEDRWPTSRILRGEMLTGDQSAEVRIRRLDGPERFLSVSGAPIRDEEGHITGGVAVARDVTERRELERELAQHAAQLEAANRQMDSFIGIVGHELKNPITAITTNLQLAARSLRRLLAPGRVVATLTDAELTEVVGRAQVLLEHAALEMRRVTRLVDDLLDIARVQSGRIELRAEPADLAAITRAVVEEQQQVHADRTIRLLVPETLIARVMADADRIAQVLTNYLTNALKYAPPERPITVSLELESERDDQSARGEWARVSVSDEGPGLPPEEQARIWQQHYRAPGIEVQSNGGVGLGLGLHICKVIVEGHGGAVGVISAVGQGSTFWFTLPLAGEGERRDAAV